MRGRDPTWRRPSKYIRATQDFAALPRRPTGSRRARRIIIAVMIGNCYDLICNTETRLACVLPPGRWEWYTKYHYQDDKRTLKGKDGKTSVCSSVVHASSQLCSAERPPQELSGWSGRCADGLDLLRRFAIPDVVGLGELPVDEDYVVDGKLVFFVAVAVRCGGGNQEALVDCDKLGRRGTSVCRRIALSEKLVVPVDPDHARFLGL